MCFPGSCPASKGVAQMSYTVKLITPDEKNKLLKDYEDRLLYTHKADVYGCCIKLLTDIERLKNLWEDNFFSMSENTRSHGRLVVLEEPDELMSVSYEPYTKTAFLINVDYYGWIKRGALGMASDLLERENGNH